MSVMVITGGTAGAGKATALRFARAGYHVALIARDETGLQETQQACERFGVKTLAISADVADAGAVQRAAAEVEATLGAIDVWINNAMTTVLAPFRQMSDDEFRRVTEVTYLGYVNGTRAALEVMTPRDRGVIIQAGSALAWRSIPLQSAYCGAKAAIRGFTDAVRTELMHEKSQIQLTMVQLPGMNTAQFGWARNKMEQAMQPVPPVYQPEVAAEAIYSVIQRPVNELWVGKSTIQSILGQVFFPRLLDRLMVKKAWEGQFTGQPKPAEHQDDLFTPVRGNHPGHGPFNDGARRKAVTISADLPGKVAAGVGVAVATMGLRAFFRRPGRRR
ncbi:TPA: SDR family oxidoreductase [Klebsiella quasipneumoniae]|nr:SDR family oxidoreductase [Klebsiella quasipneumoniae]